MAPGEPTALDVVVEESGFTFVINKNLAELGKRFYIDADKNGWPVLLAQGPLVGSC